MTDRIFIVGLGDDGPQGLGRPILERIAGADLLFGGERHLAFFPEFAGERVAIKSNLKEIADLMKRHLGSKKMVVLASGDPNFYGVARFLVKKLGKAAVEIHPAVSAMQLAFARVKESWDDAVLVSVHARPIEGIIETVRDSPKVGIFTDDRNTPSEIARALVDAGVRGYRAFVCENLGGSDERVSEAPLEALPGKEFSPLNVLILKKEEDGQAAEPAPAWGIGIPEEEFECMKPRRGLITKTEVRVISLSKMALKPESVVWDIGAGSGSVAIESALMAPRGRVYAIEKDEDDVGVIGRNLEKFGTKNVRVIHGRAPQALEGLEVPDAVFVGGSGGGMERILDLCMERLRPGGSLVANLATIENLWEAYNYFKQRGTAVDVSQVQVSRGSPILNLTRFEAFNPVYVLSVRKPKAEEPAAAGSKGKSEGTP